MKRQITMPLLAMALSTALGGCAQAPKPDYTTARRIHNGVQPIAIGGQRSESGAQHHAIAISAPRTVESELAKLTRIEHELELLEPAIREAQASALQTRAQFDYEQLLLDLSTVRLRIRKYRAGELEQPRAIEALSGDYRR